MPCGCAGKNQSLPKNGEVAQARSEPRRSARVAVYEVVKDGSTIVSTTSPSAARSESKRIGGSIRVSSRPVEAGDPVAV